MGEGGEKGDGGGIVGVGVRGGDLEVTNEVGELGLFLWGDVAGGG